MSNITGIVKWYNKEKGYGFISCNDGKDVFAHHSQIKEKVTEKHLHEGESVSLDIQDGQRGPMAINIQKL